MTESIEISDHPGYRVTQDGRVQSDLLQGSKNRRRTGVWRDIQPYINKATGYAYYDLRTGKRRNWSAGALVATAFFGPKPIGMECCHNDGNPLNNHISNLRWDTKKANMEDMVRHGTVKRGERQELSKLKEDDIRRIRARWESGEKQSSIMKDYCVTSSVMSEICTGKAWKHVK